MFLTCPSRSTTNRYGRQMWQTNMPIVWRVRECGRETEAVTFAWFLDGELLLDLRRRGAFWK